jgi:pimeloyl-ACP methyl ester carboxylesterase
MTLFEKGSGPVLIVIPGIQGRWQYIQPAIDALSASFRVITFPLCDEPTSGLPFDAGRGIDDFVEQVTAALDQCGAARAPVCGISFGGLIALRFAARHGNRTSGLVLTSTPGPGWHLRPRHEFYARFPHLFGPLFLAETPLRLRRELAAAFPNRLARARFACSQMATVVRAPLSLERMAARARLITGLDIAAECARVTAPTLVVTGERHLDHVVPADGTTAYLELIRGARAVVLPQTGHLGSITRPIAFAGIVRAFVGRRSEEVA